MPSLKDIIPDTATLITLDPEELGLTLLRVLVDRKDNNGMIHPGNFESELFRFDETAYPREDQDVVLEAVRESFAWLEGQALLVAPDPMNAQGGWRRIGRRGRRLATEQGAADYKQAALLPKQLLHPRIKDKVYLDFQRGDYQSAVFKAFREVEIAVRDRSGITGEVGVTLTAHELPENDPDDESYVRLVITVETRVINVDMFNLNLA